MERYTVEFVVPEDADLEAAGRTVTVEVDADRYLLSAAREAGLWLPADCQQGWCTTCAARLLSGEVDQSDARRYYDVDEAADLILPCTARPRSDLRIETCQERAMLEHRAANSLPPGSSKL
jgi:ferredoxin